MLADTARALLGWVAKVAEEDTGFVPVHAGGGAKPQRIAVGDTTVWEKAGPGRVRAILFADLDGDSLLSALPDSAAVPDTVLWRWEPYAVERLPGDRTRPAPGDDPAGGAGHPVGLPQRAAPAGAPARTVARGQPGRGSSRPDGGRRRPWGAAAADSTAIREEETP